MNFKTQVRINQIATWSMLLARKYAPYRSTNIAVTGFPKSGTTWVCHLFAESLGYQFHPKPTKPTFNHSIIHCHRSYSFLKKTLNRSIPPIFVVRDPRDVLNSAYHALMKMELRGVALPKIHSDSISKINALHNLEDKYLFFYKECFLKLPGTRLNWGEHLQDCIKHNGIILRYEDLKNDPFDSLTLLYQKLDLKVPSVSIQNAIEQSSFENMKKKMLKKNVHESFFRKGTSGQFQDDVPQEVNNLITTKFGREMEIIGYQ